MNPDSSEAQAAANIAFAQSPPGIGRKRPSLPGQPLGDPASGVPFGCRKCFPFIGGRSAYPTAPWFARPGVSDARPRSYISTFSYPPRSWSASEIKGVSRLHAYLRTRNIVQLTHLSSPRHAAGSPRRARFAPPPNTALAQSSMDRATLGPWSHSVAVPASRATASSCRQCNPLYRGQM